MGLKDKHPEWPEFNIKSKHYVCWCQIDNQEPFALSGHKCITPAHHSNGNLARYWKSLGKTAKELVPAIWTLYIDNHVIKLTVDYIEPNAKSPVNIDDVSIRHESGYTQQSFVLFNRLMHKLQG